MRIFLASAMVFFVFTTDAQVRNVFSGSPTTESSRIIRIPAPGILERRPPVLTTFGGSDTMPVYHYWMGSSVTHFAARGRLTSTYIFNTNGELKESRAMFSLKKEGSFSAWKIQVSPQRRRPLLIYTIPR